MLTVGLDVTFLSYAEISVVKTGKITFYRVSIAAQTKTSTYDVMHDDEPKNNYTKIPLNVYFLAFCSIVYQNLLHRRVYIVVSS